MSSYMDGISNISSLTVKINALKEQVKSGSTTNGSGTSSNPGTFLLDIEKNFSQMLNNLMFSSNEDDKENTYDPFSSMYSSLGYNQSLLNPTLAAQLSTQVSNSNTSGINLLA